MQHDKRSTHLHVFYNSFTKTSGQLKSWCEWPNGKRLLYIIRIDSRDVTSYDSEGDTGYPPPMTSLKKTGNEFFPRLYIRPGWLISFFKWDMDSSRCILCGENTPIYRYYTKCCGKLYHWGCRVYHTWSRPSWRIFCPHCQALKCFDNLKSKL